MFYFNLILSKFEFFYPYLFSTIVFYGCMYIIFAVPDLAKSLSERFWLHIVHCLLFSLLTLYILTSISEQPVLTESLQTFFGKGM